MNDRAKTIAEQLVAAAAPAFGSRNTLPRVRSAFSSRLVNGATILVIDQYDDSSPTMSVTNDAEAVVAHVVGHYGDHRIAYRDTDGRWDELRHQAGVFRGFAPLDAELQAIVNQHG